MYLKQASASIPGRLPTPVELEIQGRCGPPSPLRLARPSACSSRRGRASAQSLAGPTVWPFAPGLAACPHARMQGFAGLGGPASLRSILGGKLPVVNIVAATRAGSVSESRLPPAPAIGRDREFDATSGSRRSTWPVLNDRSAQSRLQHLDPEPSPAAPNPPSRGRSDPCRSPGRGPAGAGTHRQAAPGAIEVQRAA
jgi:hypothetical protein